MTKIEELVRLLERQESSPWWTIPRESQPDIVDAAMNALEELRVVAYERRRLREKRLAVDEAIAKLGGDS